MARLTYSVGNEHNPGDPFGRSELALEPDGRARLEHHSRGNQHRAWTGCVDRAALERLWLALGRAGFPQVPKHPVPGGATIRKLAADESGSAYVEYYAATKLVGYDEAFAILDAIVSQLSEDTVRPAVTGQPVMVTGTQREF